MTMQDAMMQPCPVSETIDTFNTALGDPIALRPVRSRGHMIAAVGRWRHDGARIDLATTSTTQLVLSLTSGQEVERRSASGCVRTRASAGDIAVVRPGFLPGVKISGRAATLQVILSPQIVALAPCNACDERLSEAARRRWLQALASQALVALPAPSDDDSTIAALVANMARMVAVPGTKMSGVRRGGLSPAAIHRVRSLLDQHLAREPYAIPSVAQMAAAAGLSAYHFIRAFRRSEGQTPHVWASSLRLNLALRLLIEGGRTDDIADRVGFSSPSHFVSAFRRHMGVTPAVVRNSCG